LYRLGLLETADADGPDYCATDADRCAPRCICIRSAVIAAGRPALIHYGE
jgi:hypothetical protein